MCMCSRGLCCSADPVLLAFTELHKSRQQTGISPDAQGVMRVVRWDVKGRRHLKTWTCDAQRSKSENMGTCARSKTEPTP